MSGRAIESMVYEGFGLSLLGEIHLLEMAFIQLALQL